MLIYAVPSAIPVPLILENGLDHIRYMARSPAVISEGDGSESDRIALEWANRSPFGVPGTSYGE